MRRLARPAAGAVLAQDGIDRFGLMHDAANGPRHSRSCIADMSAAARMSRLPWVAPMPPASSYLHPHPSGDPASRTVLTAPHVLRGFLFFHFRQSGLCRVPILG
ncbi:hypothetical protein XFF6992_450063 [Xanthomonas citri pv. fuscans]|nr:hypothetical protein XFF7767_410027 [Xanthomonas citri pv. fuscans]SOO15919.1 hypothetical protein XFF7766_70007 [Xanthomonas citri pv. fuscans]SOO20361.1 hypothetical protein XFF6992_450063 [Xanthomonas citri pv. fuscans]